MILKPHQQKSANQLVEVLRKYNLAYLFGPPRVGKSLTAIEAARLYGAQQPIVITKKAAIKGWKTLGVNSQIINYEQVKDQPSDFVIVDEAHNFSAFPKSSQRIKTIREFCKGKPVLLLSGTPVVEGPHRLYSQMSLSSASPFRTYGSPYNFFRNFGTPHQVRYNGYLVEQYDRWEETRILDLVQPYIVSMAFEDAGITYQNTDEVVMIDPPDELRVLMKDIRQKHFIEDKPLENIPAVNQALHRVCGGFYEGSIRCQPKLRWLKTKIDENPSKKWVIMAYFREEQEHLARVLPSGTILSSTKYCEGVDLSDYDHFVLYSFGYSGAKFVQLRDRIVNINKNKTTKVIIPLLKGCLDEDIYKTVSQKKNFNTRVLNGSRS